MSRNCLGSRYVSSIVFEGDSITAGVLVTVAQTFPVLLGKRTLASWNIRNGAVSGSTTTTITQSSRPANNLAFLAESSTKALALWIGTNDLSLTTDTPAVVFGRLTTYINARKAEGFNKIALYTTMPINAADPTLAALSGTATHETRRLVYNQLIRDSVGTLANAVVDVGAHPILGNVANTTNPTWFPDGIHLSAAAYEIVANLSTPVLTAL